MPGPRIYNLFPLLAGPVPEWSDHLDRIAAMHFDWIYVNPFHYPGFSGSLYAVKDFYRLHPLLAADGSKPETLLRSFTKAAAKRRIAVMMDLVINHTSKDSVLVEEHPEWFRRDPDGELRSPRAIDPTDPRKFTVWGDLAEIAYDNPNTRPALIEYWVELVEHHLKLGFKGFRCDAAYQVPVEVWQPIVARPRRSIRRAGSSPRRSAARRSRRWPCARPASTSCSTAPSGGTSARPGCSSSMISTARSRRPSPSPKATTPSASPWRSATPSRRSWSGTTVCATCSPPRSRAA